MTAHHPLVRKLELYGPLPERDRDLLSSLASPVKSLKPHTDIIREGEKPSDVNLIIKGFAYRYKAQQKGTRQIVGYLIPGDFCDLHVFLLGEMDHSIAALTNIEIVKLPRASILELLDRPAISRAMLMTTLVDEATLREWLTNMGQRSAERRVAHFFCEWHRRLNAVGLSDGDGCELPLTQEEIGDTMGLSTVHVNRTLQTLRERGLVQFRSKFLSVPNLNRLCDFCDFVPNYLHLSPLSPISDRDR